MYELKKFSFKLKTPCPERLDPFGENLISITNYSQLFDLKDAARLKIPPKFFLSCREIINVSIRGVVSAHPFN
jgi:hypothetical protein